ncbi:MAG: hypothetical protein CO128_03710 [Ignavibacteriales bacterium CG_4_9_14_3_um_filter_30_11]|nr:MAG: hypothetical protein CO128_03710 [Ignavibacteriales bacterium CG_4_9_14_3_um_filter_30_11]
MNKPLLLVAMFITVLFYSCKEHIVESTTSIDQILTSNDAINATFSDIQSKVFNKSCALSGCHITGIQFPNLSGNAYNVIVGKVSSNNLNYIEPGNSSQSYLYLKLIGSNNINGSRMPKNAPALPQPIIDSITVWINNGAINN